jgi:ABC-2 type transport system ATP-binding protein
LLNDVAAYLFFYARENDADGESHHFRASGAARHLILFIRVWSALALARGYSKTRPNVHKLGCVGETLAIIRGFGLPTEPESAITVQDLHRAYHTSKGIFRKKHEIVEAVRGISFEVDFGELFGLVGPNGAGKTTTIKMLTTLLTPTSGTAKVLGFDVVKDVMDIRRRIGIIFGGERGLYYRVSGRENLRYFADLYGVPMSKREKRINDLLEMVGLVDRADDRVEGYSRGMKQRLHIAKGLINDPQLIFMDEPTIGLDPEAARETRGMIRGLVEKGKTILLTTHYMFEADELCQRIGVISNGKIVALDSPSALKRFVKDITVIEVEAFGVVDSDLATLRDQPDVTNVSADLEGERQTVRIQTPRGSEFIPQVTKLLSRAKIMDVRTKEPTLEDAYLKLVA